MVGVWLCAQVCRFCPAGMSVVNSMVSGEEGSSVSVECLYSERYRYCTCYAVPKPLSICLTIKLLSMRFREPQII